MPRTMKDRKVEILEAAGALLNEQGLGGLTIKNLAREVGFTEAAVYRHFESKEAILAGLLDTLHQSLVSHIKPILQDNQATPLDKIQQILSRQLDYLIDHPEFIPATFSESILNFSSSVNQQMLTIIGKMQNTLTQLVEAGQSAGHITRIIPAEDIMSMLLGSFRFLLQRWQMNRRAFNLKTTGHQHINHLIQLIQNE